MIETKIIYRQAATNDDFEKGKHLFKEYAQSLGVDLCFQGFEKELATIHEQYNQPSGALLLVFNNDKPIACAAIRKIDQETAELKRMYVQDEYRGHGIGAKLLQRCIKIAQELGYKKIRLDTLNTMQKAQALYRSFGFYEITSYRFNPLEGTIYMEKEI